MTWASSGQLLPPPHAPRVHVSGPQLHHCHRHRRRRHDHHRCHLNHLHHHHHHHNSTGKAPPPARPSCPGVTPTMESKTIVTNTPTSSSSTPPNQTMSPRSTSPKSPKLSPPDVAEQVTCQVTSDPASNEVEEDETLSEEQLVDLFFTSA